METGLNLFLQNKKPTQLLRKGDYPVYIVRKHADLAKMWHSQNWLRDSKYVLTSIYNDESGIIFHQWNKICQNTITLINVSNQRREKKIVKN